MASNLRILTVSQLNSYLLELFEFDPVLPDVWVEGEITNYSRSSRGHVYFTVKDATAQMPCVLFRSDFARVNATIDNGHAVIVHGRVSIWKEAGKLQLYVDMVQPEGMGRLELEFQALKARLEAEGLFDETRKRPVPVFPSSIGVVTSPQAAALQDILKVLRRRYPLADVLLSPTSVQGDGAGMEVAAAIRRLYTEAEVDVVIVARGGGSMEDLWAFNEESVARAIFACPVPVVSGVGHETDYTIADLVADLRAPTPSVAAELVAPNVADLRQELSDAQSHLNERLASILDMLRADLRHLELHLARITPANTVLSHRQRLSHLEQGARTRLTYLLGIRRSQVDGQMQRLQALEPRSVLRRGYAAVSRPDSTPVNRAAAVSAGEDLIMNFSDGAVETNVRSVERRRSGVDRY